MRHWLKEPLTHFLFIGAGIFLLYSTTATETPQTENRIDITTSNVDRLMMIWQKQWNRPPTQQELDGLLKKSVKQEVLYREALKMGLLKDDPVVRNRMAQKVEFISNDIITIDTPSDEVLQKYLDVHAKKYQVDGEVTFRHIYFNPKKHNASLTDDITQMLSRLNEPNGTVDMTTAGDSFMSGNVFVEEREFEVERLFGKAFTKVLFKQDTGKWIGPLNSSFGEHLVQIESMSQTKTATLMQAKENVLRDWMHEERAKINDEFVQNLKSQYEINIAKPSKKLLHEMGS